MITIEDNTLSVDESERINGLTDVILDLKINETVRGTFVDPGQSLRRYWYSAALFGFGRDGSPSRRNAREITRFGRRVIVDEWSFSPFDNPPFRRTPRERILENEPFDTIDPDSNDTRVVLTARSSLTLGVDMLDVDPATSFEFGGREFTFNAADVLFCKVDVLDSDNDNAIVASGESTVVQDFFGSRERRTGTGDNRMNASAPLILTPPVFGF